MQARVAKQMPRVVTVSKSSCRDISAQLGVEADRMAVVPVGVDDQVFVPQPAIARVPGRLMTTASSDVPMKGLVPLLEALAKIRTERPDAHLVVIGRLKETSVVPGVLRRLGLVEAVRFVSGVSDQAIVDLYAEAEVAVVPSLYEGFSLPAIEAMACGVPLVATTGGALPEVAGTSGETALLVPPNDPGELAQAILTAPRRSRAARPPRRRRPQAHDRALHLAGHGARHRRAVLRAAPQGARGPGSARRRRLGDPVGVARRRRDVGCAFDARARAGGDGVRAAPRYLAERSRRPGRRVVGRPVERELAVLTVDFDRLGLERGDRVLDLGCGAGRHAFECLRRGAPSSRSTPTASR